MRRQILLSTLVIAVAVGGTFAATRAYFTDRSTATGNNFTVGTLELEVGGANGSNVEPIVFDNIGASGKIDGSRTWTVTNKGTLDGRLYFKIDNLVNNENGCNEPETKVDTTCDNPGPNEGELGDKVDVNVYLDGVKVTTTNLATANQSVIGNTWNALPAVIIPAGQSRTVKVDWSMDPAKYGNEIQSDNLSFDSDFDLVQAASVN